MKLDRNINPDGRGKYALVNLRKVHSHAERQSIQYHLEVLQMKGVLTFGDESPGDQFFVMKYKDKFAAAGLGAYAVAASKAGQTEYADEIFNEERKAAEIGNRIPD